MRGRVTERKREREREKWGWGHKGLYYIFLSVFLLIQGSVGLIDEIILLCRGTQRMLENEAGSRGRK